MEAALPTIQWYQRLWTVSIVVDAIDPSEVTVELQGDIISIKFASGEKSFAQTIPLFSCINREMSGYQATNREIQITLRKIAPENAPQRPAFWPRLTKDSKKKQSNIKVHWSSWKDEEDLVHEAESAEAKSGMAHLLRMSNGTSINGGGDPDVIAKMQQEHSKVGGAVQSVVSSLS